MVPVARRNLLAEPGRVVMSVGGVAFAVVLVLIVLGLYRGWGGVATFFTRLPGQVWVAQSGSSDPLHTTSLLPAGGRAALARIPGVAAAMPVYVRQMEVDAGERAFVMAVGAPARAAMPAATREAFLPAPGHVIVDSSLAAQAGVSPGDTLMVAGRPLTVERVTAGGNRLFQLAFVNAADARGTIVPAGRVSFFLLALRPGADARRVMAAARAAVPDAEVRTSAEYAGAFGRLVNQGFLPVVGALLAIGAVVGGAVVAITTYAATVERARDFGVLKALGAPGRLLARIVVVQSLLIGVAGAAVGAGTAAIVAPAVRRAVPEFVTDLRWTDLLAVVAVTLVVAVAASVVPIQRINRIDPAVVFRP
ncbi:MAG TPA: FtsX-like permease family protein [Miltoncostaeaceae bacterium]|nr:FtsX-like permease family protein [Miltoncostaeaceae bacterium]